MRAAAAPSAPLSGTGRAARTDTDSVRPAVAATPPTFRHQEGWRAVGGIKAGVVERMERRANEQGWGGMLPMLRMRPTVVLWRWWLRESVRHCTLYGHSSTRCLDFSLSLPRALLSLVGAFPYQGRSVCVHQALC